MLPGDVTKREASRRYWGNVFTLLLILCAAPSLAAVLPLKDAVQQAVRNSPDLVAERASLEIRRLEKKNAAALWLPSLDLTSTHGVQKSTPSLVNDPWISGLGLTLTETFYDNGQTITQNRIALVNEEAATIGLERARDQLSLKVSTEFYRMSLARELIVLKEQQLELLKKQFAAANSQYKQGMRTRKDYLRLSTQVKRGEIELRNAENTALQSVIELRRLLGVDPTTPPEEVEFLTLSSTEPIQSIPAVAPSVENTFEVRLTDRQRRTGPLNVSLAERRFWPQLQLKSEAFYRNADYFGSGAPFNTNQNYGWNATLQITFNFLDWGIRRRDVQIAESNAIIQDSAFHRARLQANAEIRRLSMDLRQLKRNYELARDLRAAEEETYNVIRRDYEEGKVPYLDLITSLKDFLEAKTQYLNAHYGLLEAIARHHYLEGKLYETVTQ